MKTVCFATSNQLKIEIAQVVSAEAGIKIKPVALDIDEIQGEDPEVIVRDKAKRAFEQLGVPVVVSDDSWNVRALRGFPGAYMKSINHWFDAEDFIRLMNGIKDRRITLHRYLAYTDGDITEVFKNDCEGQILDEARGKSEESPITSVIALDFDSGRTIAEIHEQGVDAVRARYKDQPDVWHEFTEWYKELSSLNA